VARRALRRAVRRHRDLIWVTTLIQASILESTPVDIADIVLPADWSAGNTGFDRATLLGIRGWYNILQSTVGTSADATAAFMAFYMTDALVVANPFDPSVAAQYNAVDILWTDGLAIGATAMPAQASTQVNIKAKRKITSQSNVRVALTLDSDTASPRVNVAGCIRALLQLDPAS
jgi:hypothetical protein